MKICEEPEVFFQIFKPHLTDGNLFFLNAFSCHLFLLVMKLEIAPQINAREAAGTEVESNSGECVLVLISEMYSLYIHRLILDTIIAPTDILILNPGENLKLIL